MYKQSPSGRSHRSRGVKVKHVLQICVLLAICFWLIYQIKQSRDKKKQFDGNDLKLSQKTESGNEVPKLGRKYLLPYSKEIANSNEKHDEDEEDNNPEDVNKPEEDELEQDNNSEEKNDEDRGGGDDDLDEHDQEKIDHEVEQEDEVVDDENESEDRDSDDNNGKGQDENSEDNENDEDSRSKHEAQEQLYKADDASSAVTHDTQTVTIENVNSGLEEGRENTKVNVLEQAGEVNNDKGISDGQDTTPAQDRKTAESDSPPNTIGHKESQNVSNSQGVSSANITSMEGSNDHLKERNLTETSKETYDPSLENGMQSNLDSTQYQNVTLRGKTAGDGSNLANTTLELSNNSALVIKRSPSDSNLTTLKNEDEESTQSDSSIESSHTKSSVSEKVIQGRPRFPTQDDRWSSMIDTSYAADVEKSGTVDEMGGTDEGFEFFNTENIGEVQDLIDLSDSSIPLEEKDVRTDLETLPEIQTEGSNTEDVAAE